MSQKYEFSNTWFEGSELRQLMPRFIDPYKPIRMLEIGSYEGASACFFSDNILKHPDSRLTCVDPHCVGDPTCPVQENTKDKFLSNIAKSDNAAKIKYVQDYSTNFFKKNEDKFDFIYIDGSHLEQDILQDNINAYNCAQKGSIIWNDDYLWGERLCKSAIDDFHKYFTQTKIIHIGQQIAFIKLV